MSAGIGEGDRAGWGEYEEKIMMQHVVRISDGLGNQLFQYAFAYALARKTGARVLLDPLFWGTSLRKYQLEEFQIKNNTRMVGRITDYFLGFGPRNGRRFKDKFRQRLIRKRYRLVQEKQIMHFDDSIGSETEPCFYLGFWQVPEYFDKYYEELKIQFIRKDNISSEALVYQKKIRDSISVALHIRRTDYVREEGNVALRFDFYREALQKMTNQLGDFELFIFTDDKEFVRANFLFRDYTLVEGICDLDEFELMRQCDHHIVANSSFSWWAAYLGKNKGGIVYAPRTGIWTEEFYPKEWNLIGTEAVAFGGQ